jgi:hypothetical protein
MQHTAYREQLLRNEDLQSKLQAEEERMLMPNQALNALSEEATQCVRAISAEVLLKKKKKMKRPVSHGSRALRRTDTFSPPPL